MEFVQNFTHSQMEKLKALSSQVVYLGLFQPLHVLHLIGRAQAW